MKKKAGFTLIELLVVVLIIGILAAVALPQYQKAIDKTRLVEAFILGRNIQQREYLYHLENDVYTKSFEDLQMEIPEGYKMYKGLEHTLSHERGSSFQLETDPNYRVLYYYYVNKQLTLALSFAFKTGKITCISYTDYGQQLCKSLPM